MLGPMVRCRIEDCCPLWDPSKIMEIEAIETVQRNFTRKISGCKDLDYHQRLKKHGLRSLQRRRERYIIIHTWKIVNGKSPDDIRMEFKENSRRGSNKQQSSEIYGNRVYELVRGKSG